MHFSPIQQQQRVVYSSNWPMGAQGAPAVILGDPFSINGAQERYLNFFVQSIEKQLKKVQSMNTETKEEEKGYKFRSIERRSYQSYSL